MWSLSSLKLGRFRPRRSRADRGRGGSARMRSPAPHLTVVPLEDRCLPSGNTIVFEWTDLLLDVARGCRVRTRSVRLARVAPTHPAGDDDLAWLLRVKRLEG